MDETMKQSSTDYKHDGNGNPARIPTWLLQGARAARASTEGDTIAGAQLAVQTHDLMFHMARSAQGLASAEVGKQADKRAADLGDVARVLRQASKELEHSMAAPKVERATE